MAVSTRSTRCGTYARIRAAGEPGPLTPAFANAIARLIGKPLRQMPFKLA